MMASLEDQYRNALSTQDPGAAAVVNEFIDTYLGYRGGHPAILHDVDGRPNEPLINAYAALLWLFLESPEGPVRARPYVERAVEARAGANARERATIDYVAAWASGDSAARDAIGERSTAENPRDVVLAKAHQYHQFNRGDAPGMLRTARRALAALPEDAHVLAMAAFAFEQCHLLREAEDAARKALDRDPREPWAQHAIAHVCVTQGRIAEGRDFLDARSVGWSGLNSFMSTHLWWHLALFMLGEGDNDGALSVYDRSIWGVDKSYSQDQVGAISMLARLEWAGVDVGDRWRDVAEHVAQRGGDATEPFLTAQYILGLAKAGRAEVEIMRDAVRKRAQSEGEDSVWGLVAVPLTDAMRACAAGEFSYARGLLGPILPRLREIGGSHAQRDLFEQAHLDATLRDGRLVEAQQMLELRRARDPDGVPVNRALGEVYARLGLPEESEAAYRRAEIARAEALRRRASRSKSANE